MKRIVVLVILCAIVVLSVMVQEKEKSMEAANQMMPPGPIDNPLFTWMIGEWEGHTASPMGKTSDWQKIDWSLEKQFVSVEYTGEFTEMNEDVMKKMASQMNVSDDEMKTMMQKPYHGKGQFTINPANGEFLGFWIDNMRGMYEGTGTIEKNRMTTTWKGIQGTSKRTMEKVGEDKMVETFTQTDPMGNMMEGKTEWTRKK